MKDEPKRKPVDKNTLEQLEKNASQSLADFAMGKIDTEEFNARAKKTNARARAIRRKEPDSK